MNNKINYLLVWLIQYKEEEDKKDAFTQHFLTFVLEKKNCFVTVRANIDTSNKDTTKCFVWQVSSDLFRGIGSSHVVSHVFTAVEHQWWREYVVERTKREERPNRVVSGLFHTNTGTRRRYFLPSSRVSVSRIRPVPRSRRARPHCTRLRDA